MVRCLRPQMRAREAAAAEMAANAAKPFARTADDVDLDTSLRDQVHAFPLLAALLAPT